MNSKPKRLTKCSKVILESLASESKLPEMAVWLVIKKAIKIWFAIRRLKRAKLNAYRVSRGLRPIYTCGQLIWLGIKGLFKCVFLNLLCCCCVIKWQGWKHSLWDLIWISGTFPNELAKSVIGLVCGLVCTHLATLFLIFSLNVNPTLALSLTFVFGTIFTFSLAFTHAAKCFTMLALPPLLFSKEGRVALLAYILVLTLNGPAKNTAHNMEVLTESLVCSEEMANKATGGLIDLIKNPSSFLSRVMELVRTQINAVKERILASLGDLRHVIAAVVESVVDAYNWLKAILDICNSETGNAYDRCWDSFQTGVDDCLYHLPEGLKWACSIAELGQQILCPIAKVPQILLCWFPSFVKQELYLPIKDFLGSFMEGFKTFFKVGIHFHHHFRHSLSSSKSVKEIVRDIKGEVISEVRWLLVYVDWVDMLVSVFFLYGFIKAMIYRHRYLHSDRYDNAYITKGLVRMDWDRKLRGRQYIFPLKYLESKLYVDNFSFQLLEHEARVLRYSLTIVLVSCAKILSYLLLDVLLFMFLEMLRKYGAIRIETQEQLTFSAKVIGTGFLADMYRGILQALTPVGESLPAFDTTPCLPVAREPDYVRYAVIILLILLVILATYAEPWGLRMRHIICGWYYPERTLPRERWLYFHILNSRSNFLSFVMNQLLARFTKNKSVHRFGFLERLSHVIPCFYYFLKWMGWEKKACYICGREGDKDDNENFYHCPSCQSVFCMECFEELEEKCPLGSGIMRTDSIDEETGSDSGVDKKGARRKSKPRARALQKVSTKNSGHQYNRLRTSSPSSSSSSPERGNENLQTRSARNGGKYTRIQIGSDSELVSEEDEIQDAAAVLSLNESDTTETEVSDSKASSETRARSTDKESNKLTLTRRRKRSVLSAETSLEEGRRVVGEYSGTSSSRSPATSPGAKSSSESPALESRQKRSAPSTGLSEISTSSQSSSWKGNEGRLDLLSFDKHAHATSKFTAKEVKERELKRKIVRIEPKEETATAISPLPDALEKPPFVSKLNINFKSIPQDEERPVITDKDSSTSVSDTTSTSSSVMMVSEIDQRRDLAVGMMRSPKSYYKLYYKEEDDASDEDAAIETVRAHGLCYQYRSVDEENYSKYSNVVTELESVQGRPTASTTSSSQRGDGDDHGSGFESSSILRSSTLEDDLDSGICYHHQGADEETYSKYSDVVTELEDMHEDMYGTPTSTTSEEVGKSSTDEDSSQS